MSSTYYTVYLRSTDELVVHGNAVECAIAMKKSIDGFYSMVSKNRKEIHKKYTILIDRDKDTLDDTDNDG